MTIICGVDVSAQHLDAQVGRRGVHRRFENTVAGVAALAAFCREQGVDLVALEATGGYERLAFGLLSAEGIGCAVLNPRQVRDFAKAMGHLEKTDRIDAGVIARFAEVREVTAQPPAGAAQERLRSLFTSLRRLIGIRSQLSNAGRLETEATVRDLEGGVQREVEAGIRRLEGEIASAVDDAPLWSRLNEAFREIKGVGDRSVAVLLALVPEIGTISNKAIAKLAGLAPMARDSGMTQGRRAIRGGRREVRDILYMAAHCAARCLGDFKDFAERLRNAGKPPRVIRIAIARKLLVRLNAKARDARKELAMPT